jgi:hypothetical protein
MTTRLHSLHRSNFANSCSIIEDINRHNLDTTTILSIGIGESLTETILRGYGIEVTTFDIDRTKSPDVTGSILDLGMFKNKEFSLVIASHVVEHVPFDNFLQITREISRISRFSLLYLPTYGKIPSISFDLDALNVYFDRFLWLKSKYTYSNDLPLLCAGQHYWEIGASPHRVEQVLALLKNNNRVLSHYLNQKWKRSYNFVLKSL